MTRGLIFRALLLSSLPGISVFADTIELKINANIGSSNMTAFPVSQAITITLQYESSGSAASIQNQQAFYIDHIKTLRIQSGAYDGVASLMDFGQIVKYDNLSNFDGVQFRAMANAAAYQYVSATGVVMPSVASNSLTQTFDGIYINFLGVNSGVFSDYTLPTAYSLSDFNVNFGISFSNGSFGINDTTAASLLTVTNVSQVPEPGSAALLFAGGAAVVASLARRRIQA